MDTLVLVEPDLWDDFRGPLETLPSPWAGPSGRTYRLVVEGRRLEIWLEGPEPESPRAVDDDLFELACRLYDARGGDWSADALRQTAEIWGWAG